MLPQAAVELMQQFPDKRHPGIGWSEIFFIKVYFMQQFVKWEVGYVAMEDPAVSRSMCTRLLFLDVDDALPPPPFPLQHRWRKQGSHIKVGVKNTKPSC